MMRVSRARAVAGTGLLLVAGGCVALGLTAPQSAPTARHAVPATTATATTSETSAAACAPGPSGMTLHIPSIALRAPVLEGVDRTTLDRGVGHLPSSDWPNRGTTPVLTAHNNSFFHRLDQLRSGDNVLLSDGCRTWNYEVTTGQVMRSGDPVYRSGEPTVVLVTCWPMDKLTATPHRYVVHASLRDTR
jgi:sortase A